MSAKKGIVLESNNEWSTVLMEGGHYKKVRQSLEVGEIYYENPGKIPYYTKYAVAAVLVLVLLGAIDFFNVIAYANVSTGVEMGVNRWNRVVSVNYTDDTENVPAKNLALKGQKIEDAVVRVIQETAQEYDPAAIKIEVTSKNENNLPLEEKLMGKIETSIDDMGRNDNGKAFYQRQGKVIEIQNLEKLVHKPSSSKNNGKNSDQSDPPRGNKDKAANNNNNKNWSPANEDKNGPTKGQMEQTDRTRSPNNVSINNPGTPSPAKDKNNDKDKYKEKDTGKTKAKNNSDNSKPSPAKKNSSKGNNKSKSPN